MRVTTLVKKLNENLCSLQSSERWTMYRLVVPVLDCIFGKQNDRVYFELSIGNPKVDIGIKGENGKFTSVVEVKKYGSRLAPGQITKYTNSYSFPTPVVLTNGIDWHFFNCQ